MMLLKSLIFFFCLLLMIAFFTLLERKVLSFIQLRKGPNLVGILGMLQPISDGIKLLGKNMATVYNLKSLYLFSPLLFFYLSLIIWVPLMEWNHQGENNFLLILLISSISALFVFFSGWSGKSKFSLLGGVRASAQMVSYEVIFSFGFLMFICFFFKFKVNNYIFYHWASSKFFLVFFVGILMVIILAETNRTPFDLTEGESELVSGFNTEFASTQFVLLFLGEYSFICFFSFMMSMLLFFDFSYFLIFLFLIVWSRASFPRKRYDYLMTLMWIWLFPVFCLALFLIVELLAL